MKYFFAAAVSVCAFSVHAEMPALIPREVLFGNPELAEPQISPDGSQLSWLAPNQNNTLNVWTSALDRANPRCMTNEKGDPIEWYAWSADGKQILYLHDNAGDEVPHLFSVDLTTDNVRDLTPFRGVRAQNVLIDSRHSGSAFVAMNLRDRMFSTCIGWIFRRAPSPSRPQILVTSSLGRRTATSSSVPPPRSMGKPAEQPFVFATRPTSLGVTSW